ncbi:MAG TPA: hypothetical protein VMM77_01570 [Gemmatimonadaceae bacterium]|nr:hypothetical protein [Gemmatimonadaceae bacterium]
MDPLPRGRVSARMRLSGRLGGLLLTAFLPFGCEAPTGLDELGPRESLIETHRAIVDGVVRGSFGQPLEDVDVVLKIAGSSLPAPTTQTDTSGRFYLVLAIYNGTGGADSVAATLYAYAAPPSYSTRAAGHADLMVRFLPVSQDPRRTSVEIRLSIF